MSDRKQNDIPDGNPTQGLAALGFTEYEARAYLELLRSSPAGAYEIAKSSGIPSSKVYQTLARLVERNAAMPVTENGKTRYVPMDPQDLIDSRRHRLGHELDLLKTQLRRETRDAKLSYVWNISDYTQLMDRFRKSIAEAKKELVVSAWNEEISQLSRELVDFCKRGGKLAIVLFGSGPMEEELQRFASIYPHPIEDTLYAERGGRALAMASDGKHALMATVFPDQKVEGAWSMNHGFVLLAEDYIKHDIYLMKIVQRFDDDLTSAFGERYRQLRDVFSNLDQSNSGGGKK